MTKITLTNDFHNTGINLILADDTLSAHQLRRARKALCGVQGCTCGGIAGERGPQYLPDGRRFQIEPQQDGSAIVRAEEE